MGLKRYEGVAYLWVGARRIGEATGLEVDEVTNDSRVTTFQDGLAGFSDGPHMATIRIDSAVPTTGTDVDFLAILRAKEIVRITWRNAADRYQYEGRFTQVTNSRAVDSPATASITFEGKPIV